MARILITGASGFVGRATVEAAQSAGHEVVALGRRAASIRSVVTGTEAYQSLDLAHADAEKLLGSLLGEVDAVIHAAAAMIGDDATHARATLAPMKTLLAAIESCKRPPRVVLVSSLAVYGYAALPDGTLLNELTPLESETHKRDAYCRAKLTQEALAEEAARAFGLDLWLIRPGAIYGPKRLETARLGMQIRGRWISPGGNPTIPAVDVTRVAAALVAAATVPKPKGKAASGPMRPHAVVINVLDTDQPRQSDWAGAVGTDVTTVPKALFFRTATYLELLGDLLPGLGRKVPKSLLPPRLAARFKHLRYATQRAEDILGLTAPSTSIDRLRAYAAME